MLSSDGDQGVRFHEASDLEARHAGALARTVQHCVLRCFARGALLDPSAAASMGSWQGTGGWLREHPLRVKYGGPVIRGASISLASLATPRKSLSLESCDASPLDSLPFPQRNEDRGESRATVRVTISLASARTGDIRTCRSCQGFGSPSESSATLCSTRRFAIWLLLSLSDDLGFSRPPRVKPVSRRAGPWKVSRSQLKVGGPGLSWFSLLGASGQPVRGRRGVP